MVVYEEGGVVFGHRSPGVAVFEKHAHSDEATGRNEGARECTVVNELTNVGLPADRCHIAFDTGYVSKVS
jgi:hypothetical protein